jgi:isoleucyl-tRNA synthetase
LGKRLPALKQALAQTDAAALLARLEAAGQATFDLADGHIQLDKDDIQVRLQAKPGWAAAQGPLAVVVVSTELTDELATEGLARELAHAIQGRRKDLNCRYTDRIRVGAVTQSAELLKALRDFSDYIRSETLAVELSTSPLSGPAPVELDLGGHPLVLYVAVAGQ